MSKRNERGREIHEFFDVVAPSDGSLGPVVVGGQAANAWAIYYGKRIGAKLRPYRPFTSKDLDVAGDRKLLERIRQTTQGTLTFSEPRSPDIGMVETGSGKTAAFGLPGLAKIDFSIAAPQMLVVCPTRELAVQVCQELGCPLGAGPVFGSQPVNTAFRDVDIAPPVVELASTG